MKSEELESVTGDIVREEDMLGVPWEAAEDILETEADRASGGDLGR